MLEVIRFPKFKLERNVLSLFVALDLTLKVSILYPESQNFLLDVQRFRLKLKNLRLLLNS